MRSLLHSGLAKPVVAAVNGRAIAGGAILVSASDHRVMSSGRIGVTELRVGVPFPWRAMEILNHALGATRARAVIIDGETYDPPTPLNSVWLTRWQVTQTCLSERSRMHLHSPARSRPTPTGTKRQPHRDTDERIERWRAEGDAEAIRLSGHQLRRM